LKLGRTVRYSEADLLAFLAARRVVPTSQVEADVRD
jgi:hypothetical protein